MKTQTELLSLGHYVNELKPHLPEEIFRPSPGKLWKLGGHLIILIALYVGLRFSPAWYVSVGMSLLIANSLACIAFLAHDLSHNTIIRNRSIRYPMEVFFWGINLIPATMWIRVHNRTHHAHANTVKDPDRRFMESEKNRTTRWYSRIFYPSKEGPRWNPLVGTHFVPYILRNIAHVFYHDHHKPAVVPHKVPYTNRERIKIIIELGIIVVLQIAISKFVGGGMAYALASPIPIVLVSVIIMIYVFTNHYLNPICETHDPVAGSTSVDVPAFFDRLHENFSYHTEHHLFPGVDSSHYPKISEALESSFPERYNRLPIGEAWHKLWKGDEFEKEPGTLTGK